MTKSKNNGTLVAIIAMMFLFAMISFVTNMAAPFGNIWGFTYEWAGMLGNMMNFAAYLFMGIPAGIMITKMGYKKTALVGLALGFVGICIQYLSSTTGAETAVFAINGQPVMLNFVIYLIGAFVCGFCVCILNTVVNPMLNLLGGGGNRGNQFIQIGGSLNSLSGTLTPMLVGVLIGTLTEKTSMSDVSPLLFIAMAIFAASFIVIYFTKIVEPEQEKSEVVAGIKAALGYRHLIFGIIAIFFYVGVEIGLPSELNFYISNMPFEGAAAVAGSICALYWLLMLVGRFTSSFISGKISTRTQIVTVSSVALIFIIIAILMPESIKMTLYGGEVPVKCLFIVLCGLCTSVMWGGIFNLATEGLGKYTASASGLFMTMVVGGGIMPLIQHNVLAKSVGYIQSYWLVAAMVAYILFFGLIGSRPSKKA